jgi:hypothetical protein
VVRGACVRAEEEALPLEISKFALAEGSRADAIAGLIDDGARSMVPCQYRPGG